MDIIARVARNPAPAGDEDPGGSPLARVPGAFVDGPPARVPVDAFSGKVFVAGSPQSSTPKIARALLEQDDYALSDTTAPNGREVDHDGGSQGWGGEMRMPIRAPVTADEVEDSDLEDAESDSGASYDTANERMAAASTISSQYGSPRGTPTGSIFGSEAGDSLHRRLSEVLFDEPSSSALVEAESGRKETQFRRQLRASSVSDTEDQERVNLMPVAKVTADDDDGQGGAEGSGYIFDDESGEDEGLDTATGLYVVGVGEDDLVAAEGISIVGTSQDTLVEQRDAPAAESGPEANRLSETASGNLGRGDAAEASAEGLRVAGAVVQTGDTTLITAEGLPVAGAGDAALSTGTGLPIAVAGDDVRALPSAQGLPIAGVQTTAEGLPIPEPEERSAAREEYPPPTAQGLPVAGAEGDALLRAEWPSVTGAEKLVAAAEGEPLPEVAGAEDLARAREDLFPPTAQGLPVAGAEEFLAAPIDSLPRTEQLPTAPEGEAVLEIAGAEDDIVGKQEEFRPTDEGEFLSEEAEDGVVAQEENVMNTAQVPPDAGTEVLVDAREDDASPTAEGLLVSGIEDAKDGAGRALSVAEAEDFAVAGEKPTAEGLSEPGAVDLTVAREEPTSEGLSVPVPENLAVGQEELTAEVIPVAEAEGRPVAREELTADGFLDACAEAFAVADEEQTAEGDPGTAFEDLAAPTAEGLPVAGAEDLTVARAQTLAELALAPEAPTDRAEGVPDAGPEHLAGELEGRTAEGLPDADAEDLAVEQEEPTAEGFPITGAEKLSCGPEKDALPTDSASVAAEDLVVAREEPTAQGLPVAGAGHLTVAGAQTLAELALVPEVATDRAEGVPDVGPEHLAGELEWPTAEGLPDADAEDLDVEQEEPTAEGFPIARAQNLSWKPEKDALRTDRAGAAAEDLVVAREEPTVQGLPVAGAEHLTVAGAQKLAELALAPEVPIDRAEGVPDAGPEHLAGELEGPKAEGLPDADAEDLAVEQEEPTAQGYPIAGAEKRSWEPEKDALPTDRAGAAAEDLVVAREEPTAQGLPVAGAEHHLTVAGAQTLVELALTPEVPTDRAEGVPDAGPEHLAGELQGPTAEGLPDAGAEDLAVEQEEPTAEGYPIAGAEKRSWEPEIHALPTDSAGVAAEDLVVAREEPTAQGLPVAGAEHLTVAEPQKLAELALAPEVPADRAEGVPDAGPEHLAGELEVPTAEGLPDADAEDLAVELEESTAEGFPIAGAEKSCREPEIHALPTDRAGAAAEDLVVAREEPTAQGLPVAGAEHLTVAGAQKLAELALAPEVPTDRAEGVPDGGPEHPAGELEGPTAEGLLDADAEDLAVEQEESTAEGYPIAGAEKRCREPEKDALPTDRAGAAAEDLVVAREEPTAQGLPVAGAEHFALIRPAGAAELAAVREEDAAGEGLVSVGDDFAVAREEDAPPTAEGLPVAGVEVPDVAPKAEEVPVVGADHAELVTAEKEDIGLTAEGLLVAAADDVAAVPEENGEVTDEKLPISRAEELLVAPKKDVALPGAEEAPRQENALSVLPSAEGLVSGAAVAAPPLADTHPVREAAATEAPIAGSSDAPAVHGIRDSAAAVAASPSGFPGSSVKSSPPLHVLKEPDTRYQASPQQPTSTTQYEIEDSKYEPGREKSADIQPAPDADGASSVRQLKASTTSKGGGGSGATDGVGELQHDAGGPGKHKNLAELLYNEAVAERSSSPVISEQQPIVQVSRLKILQVIQSLGKSAHTKAVRVTKTTLKLCHLPTITCFSRKQPRVLQSDDDPGTGLLAVPRS